ncbi:lysophospholipase l2 pldb, hydrolase of alpha/beta superfamily [Ectocarpus siliculosus]|uniref:Lysophospholipase l2 pldb, hydrolase of alpha/beta superfamily n=1 Tax=Ectocarpus siliculosus TaxID=2880 RepID=D7G484_ECTSI|nr:lysophospholipase l2 pldb, hydrolase of alpha/beta superfamily [Ectocarpus siliculosus]|eukprot:CBJ27099.1 lysophospholipase l2 pldb, hydrolase of alpha/beta superfamily [Ectocarpus siliculosus]
MLRQVLAQCEAAFLAGTEDATTPGSVPSSSSASETAAAAPGPKQLSAKSAPLEGLRRFSRDGTDGVFMGAAGVPVRYRLFPKYSKGEGDGCGKLQPGVILLTGLMESMTKYGETIAHLNDRGFSVYTYDHHGQGLSGRLPVPDGADPTVAHITDFDHYVQDLERFSKVILPATVRPRDASGGTRTGGQGTAGSGDSPVVNGEPLGCDAPFPALSLSVVAHSMGGLIAVNAALREPELFDGLVLAAPMLAPNTGKLPNGVVGALTWVVTKLGRQGHRSPIRRPARATMEWSRVTHDKERLRLWETLRGTVGCVLQRGPSFAWLSKSVLASKRARGRLHQLSVPVLVLEAGLDHLVRSDGIARFRRKVPGAGYRLFHGAYHDLFDETDDIRQARKYVVNTFTQATVFSLHVTPGAKIV